MCNLRGGILFGRDWRRILRNVCLWILPGGRGSIKLCGLRRGTVLRCDWCQQFSHLRAIVCVGQIFFGRGQRVHELRLGLISDGRWGERLPIMRIWLICERYGPVELFSLPRRHLPGQSRADKLHQVFSGDFFERHGRHFLGILHFLHRRPVCFYCRVSGLHVVRCGPVSAEHRQLCVRLVRRREILDCHGDYLCRL